MSTVIDQEVTQLAINTIRTLSIDAIEKASSGHPGMPMGAAPMAYALWADEMNHNPANPNWFNRDRFVLSAGHGSMLLYSLLHLFGYGVSLEDLKNFRQWGSKTPGHPEVGHTPGVEATTGPLGQGVAMAVGMAMAERHIAATYNKEKFNIVDHFTYSICGDGDLMEGVSAEAGSLAGHLKLGRLIMLYDSNDISLDGELHHSFSENVEERFKAYGWQVLRVEDGNDLKAIQQAIQKAKSDLNRPTLIEVKTTIGFGAPSKAGTSSSHGAPLGVEETSLTKLAYNWEYDESFHVPEEVRTHYQKLAEKGADKESSWLKSFEDYKKAYPNLAAQLEAVSNDELPNNWRDNLPTFQYGEEIATRVSSGKALNALAYSIPQLLGGSADLASSNKTLLTKEDNFASGNYAGRNIWFGVREFGMGAALNGMALHGGLKVFGATFFVFSDYLRPAMRLAAIMKLPITYVFTHDSIAVGEDGPTHEPVEQLASLRAMPGMSVIRPADAKETVAAWSIAIESSDKPTALVLTRQNVPTLKLDSAVVAEGVKRGAYVVSEAKNEATGLLLATGSEVSLAISAQEELEKEEIFVTVVSMPSWDRFDQQPIEYKKEVLPDHLNKRIAIEMGSSIGWHKYIGDKGNHITVDKFGASAPAGKLFKEYGFTIQNIVETFKSLT
ncbi:transketolase [Alkalihalophilus marmarensis]|jgi:transketolase|uniref:Transketolase n=1 Tax=Alkalihalophilus marmarensis DSM 21297 TaxID=1188261 RepID=U6SWT6_9BACI|nr:transketolase [Alkalihalophilus marmarensis]ERN55131.1 transketolase [Alkalihalophilus marmarensis DSM 21297]MCM3489231.1 transketolase [Alkalihalophilus marmarensis]